MSRKPRLLIDMDGVFADYYGRFLSEWRIRYPQRNFVEAKDLKTFYIEDSYLPEHSSDVTEITRSIGFFETIDPIEGSIAALQKILADGKFDPFICTAPDLDSVGQCCATEKFLMIEHHLGREWLKRLILTKDKTIVAGDYLIDDKPVIEGLVKDPTWERVFFTHEYNKHLPGKRLNNWAEWPTLEEVLLKDHRAKQIARTIVYPAEHPRNPHSFSEH